MNKRGNLLKLTMVREQEHRRLKKDELNTSEKKSFYSTLSKPQARHSVPNICFDAEPKISFKQIKENTRKKYSFGDVRKKNQKTDMCMDIEKESLSDLSIDLEMFKAFDRKYIKL